MSQNLLSVIDISHKSNPFSSYGYIHHGRNSFATGGSYRYSFNGMEKDDEVKGSGNSFTTLFRQYDPRIGRWLSLDPKEESFSSISPYVAMGNNPMFYTDPLGDSIPTTFYDENGNITKETPNQVQEMYNKEYGIEVGYANGKLYKVGDVKTDLKISESAKAEWEKLLGSTNTDHSLVFGYGLEIDFNNEKTSVSFGVNVESNGSSVSYIDMLDFDKGGNVNGPATQENGTPCTTSFREFNMARVVEHEFIGHGIKSLPDLVDITSILQNDYTGPTVDLVNSYRIEMGLYERVRYAPLESNIHFGNSPKWISKNRKEGITDKHLRYSISIDMNEVNKVLNTIKI